MTRIVAIILLAALPATSAGQSGDREAVLKAMQVFFDTMTARDVEGARSILVPQGRFFAMDLRKPGSEPRSMSNEEYLAQLQQSKQTMRERMRPPF